MQRMCPPNKLVPAEYGTVCEVDGEHGKEIYIQVDRDKNNPHWMIIGEFLTAIYRHKILTSKVFIDGCLHHYDRHIDDHNCLCEGKK